MSTKLRGLDRPLRAVAIEGNRRGLDAEELPDQAREGGHRATGRAARDRRHRVALLSAGARVGDEADRPVALAHLLRRQAEDDEAEAIERDGPVSAAFDLKCHRELAVALGRSYRPVARGRRGRRSRNCTSRSTGRSRSRQALPFFSSGVVTIRPFLLTALPARLSHRSERSLRAGWLSDIGTRIGDEPVAVRHLHLRRGSSRPSPASASMMPFRFST